MIWTFPTTKTREGNEYCWRKKYTQQGNYYFERENGRKELIVVVAQRVQNTLEAKNKGEFEIGESPMKIHTTLDEKVSW